MPPAYVTHRFIKELRRAGLPKVRFHDLRHGFATLLLDAGEDMKIVPDMLGHADIRTALNIYPHATRKMQQRAAGKLDALLGDSGHGLLRRGLQNACKPLEPAHPTRLAEARNRGFHAQ